MVAGAHEADGKSDLAAGGAGQELAQPYQIGISVFVKPTTAYDKLFREIAEVSDLPPKQVTPSLRKTSRTSRGEPVVWIVTPVGCVAIFRTLSLLSMIPIAYA